MNTRIYLTYFFLLVISASLFGQYEKQIQLAEQYLQQNKTKWELTDQDIADIKVYNAYQTKHNGVTHIYFNQRYQGIDVYNAVYNANLLSNGKVFFATNRFHVNIASKVNTTRALLSPEEAIKSVAKLLEISTIPILKEKEAEGKNVRYKQSNISNSDITVKLLYQPTKEGQLQLAWQVELEMLSTPDYWNIRIDARDGTLLKKDNYTKRCQFPNHNHPASDNCGFLENERRSGFTPPPSLNNNKVDGSSYNVFPVPIESPIHGDRTVVQDPAIPAASPFGWHDTDGVAGPEHTITRGNNVHAYADLEGANSSQGNEPDGGAELNFDFPFNPDGEPLDNQDAAVAQIFYMANVVHDLAYVYGFDEAAGNFQENNYGKGGAGGDFIRAEALDSAGALSVAFEPPLNNANYSGGPDGSRGRIQMYVWNQSGGKIVQLIEPVEIATAFEGINANFGPNVVDSPVSGEVAIALDNSASPTMACNPLKNPEDIQGKIALIDRGLCNFVDKVRNAEAAGAIACIVCNFEDALVSMGAPTGDNATDITIPSVFMKNPNCDILKQVINEGLKITLGTISENTGPDFVSGSFDNGIVAHEYAHGISDRLVGGPGNVGCLFNAEQMGEGWSDFFSLITAVQADDRPEDRRGVGTYAQRQGTTGQGVRRFPYSTDLETTPYTYADITGAGVHELGAVWAATLWDLYWAMSDEYGWDPDPFNGTGGNNMAIKLVMDGLKLTSCGPGFIDGRDAILAADQVNYGGANQCLIWKVFARRGVGFDADQGNAESTDAFEGFQELPQCIKELKIAKTVTDLINPGEEITVNLQVVNHKGATVTDVVVTDMLPNGLSLKAGSASVPLASESGDLVFDIGELAQDDTVNISYTLITDPNKASVQQYFDGGENGDEVWLYIDREGTDIWALTDDFPRTGEYSWHIENTANDNRQVLQLDEPIALSGQFPALRFYHWYDTEPGSDSGILEISTDGGNSWQDGAPYFLRNGYTGEISYFTFAEPNRSGFWGDSEDYIPTYLDLRPFQDAGDIIFRFRFGSDDNNPDSYAGWFIDDIEILDLLSYNGEACANSSEGDQACATAPAGGTIVETGQLNTAVENLEENGLVFKVFPNPAGDYLNVSLSDENSDEGVVTLFNMNGQQLLNKEIAINNTTQLVPFNVSQLAKGFYFVEVRTAAGVAMKKVVLNR